MAVSFFYSMMIILSSTSIWFGRNQGLYDFWFYITSFARYPRSIYNGSILGEMLQIVFSYVIPILLVVTVPARTLLGKSLEPSWIHLVAIFASLLGLLLARRVFNWSLRSYRSCQQLRINQDRKSNSNHREFVLWSTHPHNPKLIPSNRALLSTIDSADPAYSGNEHFL
ncbi:MAG: ABC-2 family transporter protein [Planctomycetaceae bacterium]